MGIMLAAAAPAAVYAAAGSQSVTGLAGDPVSIDVQAKYTGGADTEIVYKVDVAWGAMEFTYHESGTNQWNPETHQYELSTNGTWSESGNEVTIKNHSNTAVQASLAFQAADGHDVEGRFYQENRESSQLNLESAVGTDAGNPPAGVVALKLSGSLNSDMTDFGKVGQITVTVD